MAEFAAAFGSSHSVMLVCQEDDWIGKFPPYDKRMMHHDFNGDLISYDDLVVEMRDHAAPLITPDAISKRWHKTQAAMDHMRDELRGAALDALIIVGDDQHELFTPQHNPAIAIYHGETIRNTPARTDLAPDDWYRRAQQRRKEDGAPVEYPVHAELALHLIKGLATRDFDISAISALTEGQSEGHAYSFIHRRYLKGHPLPIVPIFVNTYYDPNQPTPERCIALGRAIGALIKSYPADIRVGFLGSGGLSHFVVDEKLDLGVLDAMRRGDLDWLQKLTPKRLQAGTSEIRNWLIVAGAVAGTGLKMTWSDYIPGYRTPALTGTGLGFARWS
jgi:Catalytic LigB subunit of aromatic ring-opening dioxygenase